MDGRLRRAVEEVTIVGPGFQPVERAAAVLAYRRAEPKPTESAAAVPSDRATAADAVIPGHGRILRRNLGQVLGIR